MLARRAILRAIGLGLPAILLLAACKHLQNGEYSRREDEPRDGGGGGDGGGY